MSKALGGFLGRTAGVREEEVGGLLGSTAILFCIFVAYYILRALREEFGVSSGNPAVLWQYTALASLAAHPVVGFAVARVPRHRLVPGVFRLSILGAAVFCAVFALADPEGSLARWSGSAFYVAVSVWILLVGSVFWSLMADAWSGGQGKRVFGFLSAGATLGAICGSSVVIALAERLSAAMLLVPAALLLEVAAQLAGRVMRGFGIQGTPRAEEAVGGGAWAGLGQFVRSPYLMGIGLYIVLFTIGSGFLYFQKLEIVEAMSEESGERRRIFASIDLWANVLTLAALFLFTGRIMRWIGVGVTLALMPILSTLGFGVLALTPAYGVIVVFEGVRRSSNFAFAKPARSVLFTVLGRAEKYKAKNFVDVPLYRGSDVLVGQLYTQLTAGAGWGLSATAWFCVPVSALLVVVGLLLGRSFESRDRKLESSASAAESHT